MTRAKKGDRSASVPAPVEKSGRATRRRTQPMRGLEFWDRVLGDADRTRNAIRLVCAASIGLAVIIAAVGVILIFAPSGHLQWIATVLLSSAGTAVASLIGVRLHGRRRDRSSNAPEDDDADR